MAETVPGARLHVPVQLRWGDLDAFNHVNNIAMLQVLEEARVAAFWLPDQGEPEFPTAVLPTSAETFNLIAHQEIEYVRPVPYQREPLDVQMWFSKIGGSSAEVCYEVHSPVGAPDDILYARASTITVLVDRASGKPLRLPPAVRDAWSAHLGEPVHYTRR